MTLQINGQPRQFPPLTTLPQLLQELDLQGRPVVVEKNKTALSPSEHPTCLVTEGDQFEILVIAAGG